MGTQLLWSKSLRAWSRLVWLGKPVHEIPSACCTLKFASTVMKFFLCMYVCQQAITSGKICSQMSSYRGPVCVNTENRAQTKHTRFEPKASYAEYQVFQSVAFLENVELGWSEGMNVTVAFGTLKILWRILSNAHHIVSIFPEISSTPIFFFFLCRWPAKSL